MRLRLFGVLAAATLAIGIGHAQQGTGTIVLNETNVALGDMVTFTTTYSVPAKYQSFVSVQVICRQNGAIVWGAAGYAAGNSFLLGGTASPWLTNGGPASCQADLFYWGNNSRMVILATTAFDAAG